MIRDSIKNSKLKHDSVFRSINFNYPAFLAHSGYKVSEAPYYPNANDTSQEQSLSYQLAKYSSIYENLAGNFTHAAPLTDQEVIKTIFFLRRRIQKLCRDTVSTWLKFDTHF